MNGLGTAPLKLCLSVGLYTKTQKMTFQASVTLHMLFLLPGKTTLILSIWGISTHLPCPSPHAVSSAKPSLTHPSRDDVAWPWALQSFLDFGSCYTHLL